MITGISLEIARNHLEIWLEAEAAIATSQSYSIADRTLTRANLSEVMAQIKYWQNKVAELETSEKGSCQMYRFVPRDF